MLDFFFFLVVVVVVILRKANVIELLFVTINQTITRSEASNLLINAKTSNLFQLFSSFFLHNHYLSVVFLIYENAFSQNDSLRLTFKIR